MVAEGSTPASFHKKNEVLVGLGLPLLTGAFLQSWESEAKGWEVPPAFLVPCGTPISPCGEGVPPPGFVHRCPVRPGQEPGGARTPAASCFGRGGLPVPKPQLPPGRQV